jgi:hypothetical protein
MTVKEIDQGKGGSGRIAATTTDAGWRVPKEKRLGEEEILADLTANFHTHGQF